MNLFDSVLFFSSSLQMKLALFVVAVACVAACVAEPESTREKRQAQKPGRFLSLPVAQKCANRKSLKLPGNNKMPLWTTLLISVRKASASSRIVECSHEISIFAGSAVVSEICCAEWECKVNCPVSFIRARFSVLCNQSNVCWIRSTSLLFAMWIWRSIHWFSIFSPLPIRSSKPLCRGRLWYSFFSLETERRAQSHSIDFDHAHFA